MNKHKYCCERCESLFNRKQSLQTHLKSKTSCDAVKSDITREDLLIKVSEPNYQSSKKKRKNDMESILEDIARLKLQVIELQSNKINILSQRAIKSMKTILEGEDATHIFTNYINYGGKINGCIEIFKQIFNTKLSNSCWAYDKESKLLQVKVRTKLVKRNKKELRQFLLTYIKDKKEKPQSFGDWFGNTSNIDDLKNGIYDQQIWTEITNHIMKAYDLEYNYL